MLMGDNQVNLKNQNMLGLIHHVPGNRKMEIT